MAPTLFATQSPARRPFRTGTAFVLLFALLSANATELVHAGLGGAQRNVPHVEAAQDGTCPAAHDPFTCRVHTVLRLAAPGSRHEVPWLVLTSSDTPAPLSIIPAPRPRRGPPLGSRAPPLS